MRRWVTSRQADKDWDKIVEFYLERVGINAALKLEADFQEAYDLLVKHPLIGHIRKDVHRPVRFWNVRDYLVIYWPDTDPLEILRLAHGAQDIPRIVSAIPRL